jgi:hypothetical protein
MAVDMQANIDEQIEACLLHISKLEKELWATEPENLIVDQYHTAFQQLEKLIARKGEDQRHEFVIVIPVADRPQHLESCLNSLLHLCKTFGYGGYAENRYQKVSVIIADDSKDTASINKNKSIALDVNRNGLSTLYFGLEEQLETIKSTGVDDSDALHRIFGNISHEAFYHKGPSIMRNIVYLKLNEIKKENILFYFIDSDQEFQLKINTPAGDRNIYACNYLYFLDQIFAKTNACILTGKVVGDPPVSPAVMSGNFLDDVISFLSQIAGYDPSHPCQFHGTVQHDNDEASYHDMAALFGFKSSSEPYQYQCSLTGEHNNEQCFKHFSSKLSRFFYGEHPTRKTYYHHEDVLASVKPARTVYTGNYVFKPEALKYFIPFAPLKLRMAGPVLGRIIKSEINNQFVSANLPMLHKRTVRGTGQSEFRPGLTAASTVIDLSGEFERQFYGDVMLFSMEKLIAMGYPQQIISQELIAQTVETTHATIQKQYHGKRVSIVAKLNLLNILFNEQKNWWSQTFKHAETTNNFKTFISNIDHNFGDESTGYGLINSLANKEKRHAEIINSVACYAKDRLIWGTVLLKS